MVKVHKCSLNKYDEMGKGFLHTHSPKMIVNNDK